MLTILVIKNSVKCKKKIIFLITLIIIHLLLFLFKKHDNYIKEFKAYNIVCSFRITLIIIFVEKSYSYNSDSNRLIIMTV